MAKKLRGVTVKEVLSWEPCEDDYPEEKIRKLFGRRKRLNALDILKLKISFADQLWAICRENIVPDEIFHLWACWCAERALKRERKAGREPDQRSWAAIEAKRRWVRGEISDKDLTAARDAAWAAAGDAIWAARDAAWATAWDAASATAWDAAGAATWDAEEKAQRRKLIKMLEAL